MKKILIFITLMNFHFLYANRKPASWSMTNNYEKKSGTDINRSVIHFTKGSSTSTYKPEEAPYGLVVNERVLIEGVEYFVTGWAKGSRSLLFRVFEPEKSGIIPVCEIISFGESTRLKAEGSQIKIEVVTSDSTPNLIWSDCKN